MRRHQGRFLKAAAAVLVCAVAGPVAAALAGPQVTISAPVIGRIDAPRAATPLSRVSPAEESEATTTTTSTEATTSTPTEVTTTTTSTEATTTTTTPPPTTTTTTTTTTPPATTTTTTTTTTTPAVPAPTDTTGGATETGAGTETLTGTVDPHGNEVEICEFQYAIWPVGAPPPKEPFENQPCSPAPGATTTPVAVEATVTGLAPGTRYVYRVATYSNDVGQHEGDYAFFETPAAPITTTTTTTAAITTTTATTSTTTAAAQVQVLSKETTSTTTSTTTSGAVPGSSPVLALMKPFPVVRIAGVASKAGIDLTVLRVQAPGGATIAVECSGHGCPVAKITRLVPLTHGASTVIAFDRLQRRLVAGVILRIRVYEAGVIGKYTSIVVRHGAAPLRFDDCVTSVATKPTTCPASVSVRHRSLGDPSLGRL